MCSTVACFIDGLLHSSSLVLIHALLMQACLYEIRYLAFRRMSWRQLQALPPGRVGRRVPS